GGRGRVRDAARGHGRRRGRERGDGGFEFGHGGDHDGGRGGVGVREEPEGGGQRGRDVRGLQDRQGRHLYADRDRRDPDLDRESLVHVHRPPGPALFPYTTLFRSGGRGRVRDAARGHGRRRGRERGDGGFEF